MTQFEFPEMRLNLIVAIEYLANSPETPVIMLKRDNTVLKYYDFAMAIHQVFDDMPDLTQKTRSTIGVYLKNEPEVDVMIELIGRLELVISKNNPDGSKEWFDMVVTAQKAVKIFRV